MAPSPAESRASKPNTTRPIRGWPAAFTAAGSGLTAGSSGFGEFIGDRPEDGQNSIFSLTSLLPNGYGHKLLTDQSFAKAIDSGKLCVAPLPLPVIPFHPKVSQFGVSLTLFSTPFKAALPIAGW